MKSLNRENIQEFLKLLGKRYPKKTELHLLGGGALLLLGNSRSTLDIDYMGGDIQKDDFQVTIEEIASEFELDIEPVPIARFIPVPDGSNDRNIHIGQFGNVDVYVFDPYSIALSKVDRGFDTDFDDIIFLIQHDYIDLTELEKIVNKSIKHSREYDLHPEIIQHFEYLKSRLK